MKKNPGFREVLNHINMSHLPTPCTKLRMPRHGWPCHFSIWRQNSSQLLRTYKLPEARQASSLTLTRTHRLDLSSYMHVLLPCGICAQRRNGNNLAVCLRQRLPPAERGALSRQRLGNMQVCMFCLPATYLVKHCFHVSYYHRQNTSSRHLCFLPSFSAFLTF
jgi:hypothetical protein